MPNLGPSADLAVRLKNLEDQVARLQANPLGQAFSTTQSDGSIGWQSYQDPASGATALVFHQGPTTGRDAQTNQHPSLMFIGQLYSGGAMVDSGVIFSRPDGSQSQVIGNRGTQILDAKGNQILASDEYGSGSGEGIGRPYLPLPAPVSTGVGNWPNTTSTTAAAVAECQAQMQHPRVWWNATAAWDSGVTGTVQLKITIGSTVTLGATHSVGAGISQFIDEVIALPQPFYGRIAIIDVLAQVTGGSGKVYCQTWKLYGISS